MWYLLQVKKGLCAVFIFVWLFAGCAKAPTDQVHPWAAANQEVTDDLGRTIRLPVNIMRVVSTAPSITENIFAVSAGDRLVGVTTFCDYPEQAKSIQKIGDTMMPSIETIVALKPDVVFVTTASQIEAFSKTLEQNGIAVYVTNPTSLDGVISQMKQLAIIFGTKERAEPAIAAISGRKEALTKRLGTIRREDEDASRYDARVGSIRVFVQLSKEPLFTIGSDAFLNDLLETAGGRSVTESVDSAFPKLSKETALMLNPDAIILSDSPDNQEPNDAFRNSSAVENGRVYKINADLLARPGPRLVDALYQIAQHLHPDKFD